MYAQAQGGGAQISTTLTSEALGRDVRGFVLLLTLLHVEEPDENPNQNPNQTGMVGLIGESLLPVPVRVVVSIAHKTR